MTFLEAVEKIEAATTYADLDERDGDDAYRKLAKAVHPDAVTEAQSATATRVFAKLARLYEQRSVLVGDIADLRPGEGGLVKVPRDPADNDLMEAEAAALTRLWTNGDPKFRPYAPRLLKTFLHEDGQRRRRRVNVLERLDGFVPLANLQAKLDPRDAAWMWRRLLTGLGWAHRAGVVHGAVFEEHVLIHPEQHGVALVDWCYSGGRVSAVIKNRHYPPEVKRDRTVTPATDIYLATALMARITDMPPPMRRFADGCLYDAPRMRPQDAWSLLGELDDLLDNLYGPRTFRPFSL
ncbi:molecular chaperone DnaJ [Actinoplanes sp. NPDC048796]|uniref:molecular chaperone DnaJ n=1 Tax=unclassified Actinoplanes TaxID=2626549 RepID=UPI0033C58798